MEKLKIVINLDAAERMYVRLADVHRFGNWRLFFDDEVADAYFLRRHNEEQAKRNRPEGLTHKSAAPQSGFGPDSTRREHDHSTLLKKMHIDATTFQRIVLTLHMCDMIEEEALSRRKTIYTLKTAA